MMLRSPETARLTSVLDRIVDALKAYDPEQIILYGSLARGDAGEFSDIDLIVVKETDVPRRERMMECREHVPSMLGVDVDIVVYTPAEIERSLEARNPFIAAAFTDGVVVYDRHPSAGTRSLRFRVKEPTMESRIRNGQVWMERAQNQLRIAEALMPTAGDFASGICFHCQQAAEIALKAFLLFRGVPLDYTHSLQSLAAQCVREDPDFDSCTEAAGVLTAYYIDTRYATEGNGFFFQDREPAEARAALDHANRIVSLAQSKIPPRRDSREAPQEDL